MITYLKGTILAKQPKFIILLVNSIGYKIFALQTFLKKIKLNQELELYTHLRHTEDNMSLFGFATQEELQFFELLLTISGVGPKSAMGILEAAKLTDVKRAILRDDPSILYKVSQPLKNKLPLTILIQRFLTPLFPLAMLILTSAKLSNNCRKIPLALKLK